VTCYLTGDLHGTLDPERFEVWNFPEGAELTKADHVIVAGDFGLVFDDSDEERRARGHLANRPWTTLFVDGNHENFEMLDEFPLETWHGGQVHRISKSLLHLMRGQVFEIEGRTVFTMGGARSIDAEWREPGFTWWPQEMPTHDEMLQAEAALAAHGWKVDVVVTHDCSARILHALYGPAAMVNPFNLWLDSLEDRLDFGMWYFGHHHQDRQVDERHRMLYRDFVAMP